MRFYRIQLNNIYLTDDATSAGVPCKLSVTGAAAVAQTRTGQTTIAADGTPVNQTFAAAAGKVLEIKVETLTAAVWADIILLFNDALSNSATINIVGTGEIGNFDVSVLPLLPKPFEASEFTNGRIKNAVFRFVTA